MYNNRFQSGKKAERKKKTLNAVLFLAANTVPIGAQQDFVF